MHPFFVGKILRGPSTVFEMAADDWEQIADGARGAKRWRHKRTLRVSYRDPTGAGGGRVGRGGSASREGGGGSGGRPKAGRRARSVRINRVLDSARSASSLDELDRLQEQLYQTPRRVLSQMCREANLPRHGSREDLAFRVSQVMTEAYLSSRGRPNNGLA